MGRAGREGFGPSCGWVQLSDRRNYFDIRAKYQEEQNRGKQHSNHIGTYFIKRSVPTGQGDQRGISQKKPSICCETQKGSEDTRHVCAVGTGIPAPRRQQPTAGPSCGSWAEGGAEAAHGRTGHGPRPQEERPRSKEEARLMVQLSEETLLSWVQRVTRILGRLTDT
jgi:hypothetical protein